MLEERNVGHGLTMPRTESLTPYDETVALVLSGVSDVVVAQRLRERGLDDESVKLLLNTVQTRSADSVEPVAKWVGSPQEPAASDAAPSALELPTDDTTLGPCTRCGTFVTVAT